LVSSQLDGDRLDYLARDGYMAGIQSHYFDSARLISFLGISDNRLVVDTRARDVLENYLLALDQMYQSVYYHHTVRAASFLVCQIIHRAIDVAREGEPETVFPVVAGRRDPLWGLVSDGVDCPISDFTALDEPHVWNLFRYWTSSDDQILSDLSQRMATRRFAKAIALSVTDFKTLTQLEGEVKSLWNEKHPQKDASYYIGIDEPDRVGYKRYKTDEGPRQSILLIDHKGEVEAIEDKKRSIVSVISERFVARRLLVPPEISDEARRIVEEKEQ
jgi:HD superfamily phosphohydrolase